MLIIAFSLSKEPRAPSARTSASRSLDLRRVKMAISEHTDKSSSSAASGTIITTTSAPSTTQQVKKPLLVVKPKSDPPERKMPSTNARQDHKRQINSGETRSAAAAVATAAATAAATATLRPKSWPNKLEVSTRLLALLCDNSILCAEAHNEGYYATSILSESRNYPNCVHWRIYYFM